LSLSVTTKEGRLTRDAELKYTTGGQAILHFSIVTSRRVKKNEQYVEEPSFWDCVLWGKQGESLAQYMTKGKGVVVSGEEYQDRWEQEGVQRMKVCVNVTHFGFSSGSPQNQSGDAEHGQGQQNPATRQEPRKAAVQKPTENDFSDDIPF
jgi:single-strand DNA-binding protein